MWNDSMNSWGWGMGWMGILFWIVLILAVVALIRYLFGKSGAYGTGHEGGADLHPPGI